MVRTLLMAASALALVSGVAIADPGDYGAKTVTIHRDASTGTVAKRITKRYINHHGKLVTKSKTFRDGFSGGSVERHKTVTDPETGMTRTKTVIER